MWTFDSFIRCRTKLFLYYFLETAVDISHFVKVEQVGAEIGSPTLHIEFLSAWPNSGPEKTIWSYITTSAEQSNHHFHFQLYCPVCSLKAAGYSTVYFSNISRTSCGFISRVHSRLLLLFKTTSLSLLFSGCLTSIWGSSNWTWHNIRYIRKQNNNNKKES